MKKRHIICYSAIFLALSLFSFNITLSALANRNIGTLASMLTAKAASLPSPSVCTNENRIDNLSDITTAGLRELNQYQNICGSFVANHMMLLTSMPNSTKNAIELADSMAATLKTYSEYGVSPIVMVEPVTSWGLVDFSEYESGFYDDWISAYFKELKLQGLTDSQMGTWVPFPEANLPYWNTANTTASDFGVIVSKYLEALEGYFPNAQGSILLSSATYTDTNFSWQNENYASLLPYITNIEPGLVDSVGLQGFPWMPPEGSTAAPITNANTFLNIKQATSMADALKTKEIWFNTGTFSTAYAQSPNSIVFVDASTRLQILDSIISEASIAKSKGYDVSINLFAQDQSNTKEAIDWSYWHSEADESNIQADAMKSFIQGVYSHGIQLSIFDNGEQASNIPLIQDYMPE